MIGIIGAMDVEVNGLKKLVNNPEVKKISSLEFVSGDIHGREVVICRCGVGKTNAAMITEAMSILYNPEVIINIGVAGAIKRELQIGDIVAVSGFAMHDMDTTAIGDPIGLIPNLNTTRIEASKKHLDMITDVLESQGARYYVGDAATGDVFVSKSETKKFISGTFGAYCCDMEGASIAQVCALNEIPFVAIRSISDSGDENSHMDYPEFCEMAAVKSIAVMESLLKNM